MLASLLAAAAIEDDAVLGWGRDGWLLAAVQQETQCIASHTLCTARKPIPCKALMTLSIPEQ